MIKSLAELMKKIKDETNADTVEFWYTLNELFLYIRKGDYIYKRGIYSEQGEQLISDGAFIFTAIQEFNNKVKSYER